MDDIGMEKVQTRTYQLQRHVNYRVFGATASTARVKKAPYT
jgi:hypothetical protein